MQKMFSNKLVIILLLLPALLLFTLVLFIPICYCGYLSLCEWNALMPPELVGLKNYNSMFFKDPIFITSLKNSLFFMTFSVISQLVMGIFFASTLSNIPRGRDFFKNIIYMPCVLSSAALGLLFCFFLKPDMGLNAMLSVFGFEGKMWLVETNGFITLPMKVIAFVALWQYVGQSMMLYMAQIAGINKSLYEASYIDGCGMFASWWYITLPLIKPMIATCVSLNCIGSLKFFDLVYNMTQGGPNHSTENIATWLYYQGFKFFKYGYSSAMAVFLLLLCLLVTLLVNVFLKSKDNDM